MRTTVKPDGVTLSLTQMQDQQQQNRNDDELLHDNEAPQVVHVDVMHSTE
jgi:hypothetical protein